MPRYDPSRTTMLRRKFSAEMYKRFRDLKGDIRDLIIDEDVFGLSDPTLNYNPNQPRDSLGRWTSYGAGVAMAPDTGGGSGSVGGEGGVKEYNLEGLSPEVQEGVKRVLSELESKYLPVPIESVDALDSRNGMFSTEAARTLGIDISGRGKKETLTYIGLDRDVFKDMESLRSHAKIGARNVFDSSPRGVLTHEFAHVLEKHYPGKINSARDKIYHSRKNDLELISPYAASSPREMFAEAFAAYNRLPEKDFRGMGGVSWDEFVPLFKSLEREGQTNNQLTTNQRWRFLEVDDKVARFQEWLRNRMQLLILGRVGVRDEEGRWTDQYVDTAYFKGADQAEEALLERSVIEEELGPQVPIRELVQQPVDLHKVELLKARAFEQLRGVTQTMSIQMGNALSDGLVRGDSPRDIARQLNKEVDGLLKKRARTIARTEVIRAHAEGSLDRMEQMGVEEVEADVEWKATVRPDGTFDSRVCPLCRELHGMKIKLEKAHGLLPRHPNCRCAWIPIVFENPKLTDTRKRIEQSIKAEFSDKQRKKLSKEEMKRRTRWVGADV